MQQVFSTFKKSIKFFASTAVAACLFVNNLQAQSITVMPVSVTLAPGQLAGSVTVVNQNDKEMSFQVRAFSWSQKADEEQLTPTDDLMVSPPMSTIAASTSQVVRLALKHPTVGEEKAYRILIDQIPQAAGPGTVRIAMRLSIPVFTQPGTVVNPQLLWNVERENGQAHLVVTNTGNAHEKITAIKITGTKTQNISVSANVSPYVLPGSTRRWPISGNVPEGTVNVTAETRTSQIKNLPVVVK